MPVPPPVPALAAVLAAILSLAPATGWSHGGGLNREGCHRETATGGYHCHRAQRPTSDVGQGRAERSLDDPPRPGGRDEDGADNGEDEADNKDLGLALLGGSLVLALIVYAARSDRDDARLGAETAQPLWRMSPEAVAGRPGVAAERAVLPRLWIGVWAATPMLDDPAGGAADGAPAMVFGRLRF